MGNKCFIMPPQPSRGIRSAGMTSVKDKIEAQDHTKWGKKSRKEGRLCRRTGIQR